MQETTRQKKFARAIQKEMSEVLQREMEDLQAMIITVSHVTVTPDFSIARIYLTCFPDEKQANLVRYLNDETKAIRFKLAAKIRHVTKIIPELFFYEDDLLSTANRIDQLLDDALANQSNQSEEDLRQQYKDYDKLKNL